MFVATLFVGKVHIHLFSSIPCSIGLLLLLLRPLAPPAPLPPKRLPHKAFGLPGARPRFRGSWPGTFPDTDLPRCWAGLPYNVIGSQPALSLATRSTSCAAAASARFASHAGVQSNCRPASARRSTDNCRSSAAAAVVKPFFSSRGLRTPLSCLAPRHQRSFRRGRANLRPAVLACSQRPKPRLGRQLALDHPARRAPAPRRAEQGCRHRRGERLVTVRTPDHSRRLGLDAPGHRIFPLVSPAASPSARPNALRPVRAFAAPPPVRQARPGRSATPAAAPGPAATASTGSGRRSRPDRCRPAQDRQLLPQRLDLEDP